MLTIYGQISGHPIRNFALSLLLLLLIGGAITAVLRFLFTPLNTKLKNKISDKIEPPVQPTAERSMQDQKLGIRCTHCDTRNPAGVTVCVQCGKKLY